MLYWFKMRANIWDTIIILGKNANEIITDHMLYIHRKQFCLCTCRLKLFSVFSYQHIIALLILFIFFLFSSSVSYLSSLACRRCLSSKGAVLLSFHRLPTEQAWRSHPSSHQGSYYFISSTMSFVKARVQTDLGADSRSVWNANTMYQRLTTDPAVRPTQGINVTTTEKPDNSLVSNAHSWQRGMRSQHSVMAKMCHRMIKRKWSNESCGGMKCSAWVIPWNKNKIYKQQPKRTDRRK